MTIADVAQAQLDAYNAQDLDWYCSYFTDDVIVADIGGAVTGQGIVAYRNRYEKAFLTFPNNRARLLSRIVLTVSVIDHELVDRGDGETVPFEVAAVYTFKGDKIARVDFAK